MRDRSVAKTVDLRLTGFALGVWLSALLALSLPLLASAALAAATGRFREGAAQSLFDPEQ